MGGFVTFPFIHRANSPEEATFLTDREKAYVKACLAKDAGYTRTAGETTRLNLKEWKAVFVDWQTYSWTFQYVSLSKPATLKENVADMLSWHSSALALHCFL